MQVFLESWFTCISYKPDEHGWIKANSIILQFKVIIDVCELYSQFLYGYREPVCLSDESEADGEESGIAITIRVVVYIVCHAHITFHLISIYLITINGRYLSR